MNNLYTPCHVCGEKTAMLHTKLCDRCYNIQANIRRAPKSVHEWVAKGCPGPEGAMRAGIETHRSNALLDDDKEGSES